MNNFIYHSKTESWGSSIFLMEKEGKAFGRLYWYNDDILNKYIEGLSVDDQFRKQKIGTSLLKRLEKISKSMCANSISLKVEKNTWMYDWYKRLGYKECKTNEEKENENNFIWMTKLI